MEQQNKCKVIVGIQISVAYDLVCVSKLLVQCLNVKPLIVLFYRHNNEQHCHVISQASDDGHHLIQMPTIGNRFAT